MPNDVGIRVGIDGEKQFRDSLKGINSQLKNLNTEMDASTQKNEKNANSQEALKEKIDILGRTIDVQKQKVEVLSGQYDIQNKKLLVLESELEKVSQEFGENSEEAGKAQNAYNRQAVQVNNLGAQLNSAKSDLSRFEDQMKSAVTQSDKMVSSLKNAADRLDKFSNKASSIGNALTLGVTTPLLAAGTASFKFASDLQENINKTEVAFKENSDDVIAWSKTTLKQYGLAQSTALEMAATWGDMGTSMEIPLDSATEMSKTLVGLAADLASFKNISIDRAQTALNAVYTGETESLKELGVVMTQANLEAYAMSKGIEKNYQDMSEAEKVTLRYQYVLDKTQNSQGDFARTSDSAANQMRIAQESAKELAAEFGQKLLPVGTKILNFANDLLDSFNNLDDGTQELIIGIGATAAATGPLIKGISGITSVSSKALSGISKLTTKIKSLDKVTGALSSTIGAGPLALSAVVGTAAIAWGVYATEQQNATIESAKAMKASQNLRNEVKNSTEEIKASIEEREKSIEEINLEAEAQKILAERVYDLADKQNLTNAEHATLVSLVQELNDSIPNLNLTIDEQTGKLSLQKDEVNNLIEANKRLIMQQAAQSYLTDIATEMATAYKNGKDLREELEKLEAQRDEAQAKVDAAFQNGSWSPEVTSARNEVRNLSLEIENLKNSISENDLVIQESEDEWDYYEEIINGTAESFSDTSNSITTDIKSMGKSISETATEAAKKLKELSSSGKETAKKTWEGFSDETNRQKAIVLEQVASLTSGVIQTINSVLGIHSPSREAKQSAQYFWKGWELETEKHKKQMLNQVSDIGNSINSSFQKSIGSSYSFLQSGYNLSNGLGIANSIERRFYANTNPERQSINVNIPGGNTGTTLNQTNNFYSPESLSPAETARLNRTNVRRTIQALR